MKPFDFNKYIKNNPLLKENVNEAPKSAEDTQALLHILKMRNANVDEAVELLKNISNSPEIDPNSDQYQGFISIGPEMFEGDELEAWKTINRYSGIFKKIMAEFGLSTEEGLHYEETVFVKTTPKENVNEAPKSAEFNDATNPRKIDDDGEPGICPACREHCTFYPDAEGDLMSDCCGAEMD